MKKLQKVASVELGGYNFLLQKYWKDADFRLQQLGFSMLDLSADARLRVKQLENQSFQRKQLSQSIRDYLQLFGLTAEVEQNLRLLEQENSVCIITGQQPALMGGPLYNLYKANSVLQLSKKLSQELQIPVIPIFWVAGNDADVEEANHFYYTGRDRRLRGFSAKQLQVLPLNRLPAYECSQRLQVQLEKDLERCDYFQEALSLMGAKPQDSFADWQTRVLMNLFAKKGLLIVEPDILMPLSKKAYLQLQENEDSLLHQIQINSQQLIEQQFTVQVDVNVSSRWMLFRKELGRVRLNKSEHFYSVKDVKISNKELADIVENKEVSLTPDALFRPLWQDMLLPCLAYCAGPGEIAYFHQLKGCYDMLGMKMPLLLPRLGATIFEKRHVRFMEKFGVRVDNFYQTPEAFKAIQSRSFSSGEELQQVLRAWAKDLRGEQEMKIFEKYKAKILYLQRKYYEKVSNVRNNNADVGRKQLEEWKDFVYPKQQLQERKLNAFYFLSRHGGEFFEKLAETPYEIGAHYIFTAE